MENVSAAWMPPQDEGQPVAHGPVEPKGVSHQSPVGTASNAEVASQPETQEGETGETEHSGPKDFAFEKGTYNTEEELAAAVADGRLNLLSQHVKMLGESAVSADVAEERGYRSVTTQSELKRLGFKATQVNTPSLLVPIHSVFGEIALYHHRPDEPRIDRGRVVKYEFPSGESMKIDVHPRIKDAVRNPSVPLLITEGVKKADAAISRGLCCIGVVGTWNWRGTNEFGGKTALPDWEGVALKDGKNKPRHVYICYDSDVMRKPQVHAALVRLSGFLSAKGARVHYIYLPQGEEGTGKTGLDDYLVNHTTEELFGCATSELRTMEKPEEEEFSEYERTERGIIWRKPTMNGTVAIPLTNFSARIVAEVVEDDGQETSNLFSIEAVVNGRTQTIDIPSNEYNRMGWPTERLGAGAVIAPGVGLRDHARYAIQMLSGDKPRSTVYTHTGWRKIGEEWIYLHAGGAIGGSNRNIRVNVPKGAAKFILPEPPSDAIAAVRASLNAWNLGNDAIVLPVLAATYRAVLGTADFSVFLAGTTGTLKSGFAALNQQHFGQEMDYRHLPADWSSTANYLEAMAFNIKDAVLVIDEAVPTGTRFNVEDLWKKVDRVLRAQGNGAGRGRATQYGEPRAVKCPRGLILSTGEAVPPGHSLTARMLIVNVSPGDIDKSRLYECSDDATVGLYTQAMSAYVAWLAPRYDEVSKTHSMLARSMSQELAMPGQHGRTPDIAANLLIGVSHYLDFAEDIGAITSEEATNLFDRAYNAIMEAISRQAAHHRSSDPVTRYLGLLASALDAGKGHLCAPDGGCPTGNPQVWGWSYYGDRLIPQGDRLGWVEGASVYLIPAVAHKCACNLSAESGESLVGKNALHRQLAERGLLLSNEESRDTYAVRRSFNGSRPQVLHLSVASFGRDEAGPSGTAMVLPPLHQGFLPCRPQLAELPSSSMTGGRV